MNPEELIQSIQDFSETPLYDGYTSDYIDILDSYSRLFGDPDNRARDAGLETALEDFLVALQNPGIVSIHERDERRDTVIEKLKIYTHRHFNLFTELESGHERVENKGIDLITRGIIPFLKAERDTTQDVGEKERINTIVTEFTNLLSILESEITDQNRDADALRELMESIIAKYEIAREAETIDARVTLLETQLIEVQQLHKNYSTEKQNTIDETIRGIAEGKNSMTHGITDAISENNENSTLVDIARTWTENNLSLYPSANPFNTETPEFEVARRMVEQVDNMADNTEVVQFGKNISLPITEYEVQGTSIGDLPFINEASLSPQLRQILEKNPDFYKAALERAIESIPSIATDSPTQQQAKVEEFIFTEFDAFTKGTLSDTFNMLQEQLQDDDLYDINLPGGQTISFATWDTSKNEVPSNDEKEAAILERNKAITSSLLFLNSLYREDVGGTGNMEFYANSIATTMWDIYTLNVLGSDYEDIQGLINIASGAYLTNTLLTSRNYARIPFTEVYVPGLGRKFRSYKPNAPEFAPIKIERERIKNYLLTQAQREGNKSWEDRINRIYNELHLHKSDRVFYSAMEETGNSFRRIVGNITRFSAPIDIVTSNILRFTPSQGLRQGLSPKRRLELRAIRQSIDNIHASPYITQNGFKILNAHFEHQRKNKATNYIDWFHNYDAYLKELGELNGVHDADFNIIKQQIENSISSNKGKPDFESKIYKRLGELKDETTKIIEIRKGFEFDGDLTEPVEKSIDKRIEQGLQNDDGGRSIDKLHKNYQVLSQTLDKVMDMDGELAIKKYMIQRLAKGVEARDLEKVSTDVNNMVGSLESLQDEKYAKIRGHIYKSDGTINEQFLKDFHTFREDSKGFKPADTRLAYDQFVIQYPEVTSNSGPANTPTPEVTPSGALIDAEGNWTNDRARIIYEANIARWALEGIEVDSVELDLVLTDAKNIDNLDDLRAALGEINTDILPTTGETADNLSIFTQRITEVEARDMILRSLAKDNIRVANLNVTIQPDGSIEYTYETSRRLGKNQVSGVEIHADINALRTALKSKHGGIIPEPTAPRGFSAPMKTALDNAASGRSARLRFLRYIGRFK